MHRREAATALAVGCPGDVADLYDRTVTDVYSYIASRIGDRGLAEDLTQDVFEAGARRVATGAVVEVAWLIGVARHKLVDHWRAQARAESHVGAGPFGGAEPPGRGLGGDRSRRWRRSCWRGLNPTYRAALVLRHVDGLGVAAVADHLGPHRGGHRAGPEPGQGRVP